MNSCCDFVKKSNINRTLDLHGAANFIKCSKCEHIVGWFVKSDLDWENSHIACHHCENNDTAKMYKVRRIKKFALSGAL
jgi:DNA-directed RNA polymerase subunit RPC12/RpoP